eukprot:7553305-Alexandrium_andersonii.AAC.1
MPAAVHAVQSPFGSSATFPSRFASRTPDGAWSTGHVNRTPSWGATMPTRRRQPVEWAVCLLEK